MHLWSKPVAALAALGIACFMGSGVARAQTIHFSVTNIALKNGESIELKSASLYS